MYQRIVYGLATLQLRARCTRLLAEQDSNYSIGIPLGMLGGTRHAEILATPMLIQKTVADKRYQGLKLIIA